MRRAFVAWGAIAVVVFFAQFSRLGEFGVYEDDYWSVVPYFDATWREIWGRFVYCVTEWPQGRPLNHFLPALLAKSGWTLGGLPGVYLLAALGLTVNGGLMLGVARRLGARWDAALFAALIYVLFPADTTKLFLTHAAHVQGAMTLSLLGIWLFLGGRWQRMLAYPIAAVCLASYETAFLPFALAPVLIFRFSRDWVKTLVVHGVVCLMIVGAFAAVRLGGGEGRAVEAMSAPVEMVWRSLSSCVIGPAVSAWCFVLQPWKGILELSPWGVAMGVLVMGVSFSALGFVRRRGEMKGVGIGWRLASGLVLWVGSYALTLIHYPPTWMEGRSTSVHVAAGIGAAIVAMAIYEVATLRGDRMVRGLFAGYLGLLGLFFVGNQNGYVESWRISRSFWRQVIELCPDVAAGKDIIVIGNPGRNDEIMPHTGMDFFALRSLYEFNGGDQPCLLWLRMKRSTELLDIHNSGDGLTWSPDRWRGRSEPLVADRIIALRSTRAGLKRVGKVDLESVGVTLVVPIEGPDLASGLRRRPLHQLVMEEGGSVE